MTYKEFRYLWSKAGFEFECSPQLSESLVKAATGDFSDFDEIDKLLSARDEERNQG